MKITVASGKIEKQKTGGLVLPVFEDEQLPPALERVDRALGGTIRRLLKRGDFTARIGSVTILHPDGRIAAERLLLAGLGPRTEFTLNRLRQMAGTAAAHMRAAGAQDIALYHGGLDLDAEEAGQALAEGSTLGLYRFLKYKTNGNNNHAKEVKQVTLVAETTASVPALQKGVRTGQIIASAAGAVRDMVNHPSADMTPTVMASKARELAKKHRMKVQVLERAQIRKLGMGALLGVASGSAQPPKFIIVEYRRGGKKPFVALVGKTITFDSGGISLKPPEGMDRMKDDMAGGAAVLGAMQAAAELKLPLNIVGLLPATENMPGGSALKPGDILTTLSGQTIEIINTDAEGRLILSDALTYACSYKPAVIVDIATLTGACGVALGNEAIGMLGNDDAFKQMLRDAGERTGERVWELPLWKEYCDLIKSDIADMKNASGRAGGVITAACLLSKFVQKHPWVHLDIAAVALTDKDRPYTPKGATGIGARLLTQFLREYAKKRS